MTCFRKYHHIERFGHHRDIAGIDSGLVRIFPKLDGTNAVAWLGDDGTVRAGSRTRELSIESDNQGFCKWLHGEMDQALYVREFLLHHPEMIVYGEWMVPHTLRTYREDVWRRFWVFDIFCVESGGLYVPWEVYSEYPLLKPCDLIEPIATINNPSEEQLRAQLECNTYLIREGAGLGEGIIIKNYEWRNKFGRQPWAKIVRPVFKEESRRAAPSEVEAAIAEEFCTPELVGKTRAKVIVDVANSLGIILTGPNAQKQVEAENRHRVIPQLLGRVFHDLITEECWTFIKKHRNPVIDFGKLQKQVNIKVKAFAEDLF